MSVKIYVVDDDAAVRDSLSMLLEAAGYEVKSYAGSEPFLENCLEEEDACAILDVNMPGMDGTTLQEEMLRRSMKIPVLFLSGKGTIPITVKAIKAGAIDFLTKPVDGALLIARVQEALQKGRQRLEKTKEEETVSGKLASLTKREREILDLAMEGLTSKEIGQRLDISYRTVEIHRAHIMNKTGTSSFMEIARMVLSLARKEGNPEA